MRKLLAILVLMIPGAAFAQQISGTPRSFLNFG